MQKIQISKNSLFFTLFLLFIFMINILFNYLSYKELKKEYIFERKVTISLGATFIEKDDTKHSLFKRADEALYYSTDKLN